jgi:hypothetical protein
MASNPSELFQLQEGMPGIQSNHMLDAFLTPPGVHADALEVFAGRARQQSQIRPAKYAKILQRSISVGFVVTGPLGPQVLVIVHSRSIGAVMRKHHDRVPLICLE